jgi:hypothetical protein
VRVGVAGRGVGEGRGVAVAGRVEVAGRGDGVAAALTGVALAGGRALAVRV